MMGGVGAGSGRAWPREARWSLALVAVALGALAAACGQTYLVQPAVQSPSGVARQVPGGDAARGKEAIVRYGCGACHTIPGVSGATALVAPSLADFGERAYIAGWVPNTPDNLVRWVQDPPAMKPGTPMPNLGVTPADARDIAAYLYTLR